MPKFSSSVDQTFVSFERIRSSALRVLQALLIAAVLLFPLLVGEAVVAIPAWGAEHVLTIRPSFLPVPHIQDEYDNPAGFDIAAPGHVLNFSILCGGWMKQDEFEAVLQWLLDQGFIITRALPPRPYRTYPFISFSATVGQINQAFHVTVMRKGNCYVTFRNFRMPARFAQGHEDYIEGLNFSGLQTECR